MNLFDLIIVAVAVAAAVGGYHIGFVTRVTSWLGLGVGLLAAVWALPWVVGRLGGTSWAGLLTVSVAALVLGASLGQALGLAVASRLRPKSVNRAVAALDRGLGAVAGVAGVVVIVWLLLPVLAGSPGWPAREVTTSRLARIVDAALPDPPDAMQALRSFVGEDRFPQVFAALQPTPELGPPPAASGLSQATSAAMARSVVRVEGVACRRVQDGSGFVAQDGVIATNAHVVAGEDTTEVIRDDGARLDATVVAFDAGRDLALLSVPGIDRPPLPLAKPSVGDGGGVFGHPGGGPLRIAPFETARQLVATGRNIYGTGTVDRDILEISSPLQHGDSGSALVRPDGKVVGVAFAIATDRPDVAYAVTPSELQSVMDRPRAPVTTGPCLG